MERTDRPSEAGESAAPLLDVQELCTYFPIRTGILQRVRGFVKAVDGVSFHINAGETLGLVGESGCGKTTVGRTILRLIPATSGQVLYRGRNLFELSGSAMRRLRREMQIIFQDPVGSLNPRMRVGRIVGEPLEVHGLARGDQLRQRVGDLLVRCGLWPGADSFIGISIDGETYFTNPQILRQTIAQDLDFLIVFEDSPAFNAKLSGAISEIGGTKIRSFEDLSQTLGNYEPGDTVNIKTS